MPTPLTPVTDGPAVPDSSLAAPTFDEQYEAFNTWEKDQLAPGMNSLAAVTYANAQESVDAAAAADASAVTAGSLVATAGATNWVSGESFNGSGGASPRVGDGRISLLNFQTYRRRTAGAGTTDPQDDPTNWEKVVSGSGLGGAVASGNVTLTATSGGAQKITPTAPGQYVTLPIATTCPEAASAFLIDNDGDYDLGVKDSTGTKLGWIRPRTGAMIGLSDNSTPAGSWNAWGLEKTGITASYANNSITNATAGAGALIAITVDANRTCLLFGGGGSCYAIVYDASTQTWGAATLVRASISTSGYVGVLSAANQVLVCTFNTNTGMEAVTLTLTGTGITVESGTKHTATLAGNFASAGQLLAVGTSWVIAYGRATNVSGIRAISVSGTTPTIGAEAALTPAVAVPGTLYASGSVVRTISASASLLYAKPYTVAGSTLTAGTQASTTVTNALYRAFVNGNGNLVADYINTTHFGAVIKLTGTVEAINAVTVGTVPTASLDNFDYVSITANKTLLAAGAGSNWYANILTDTGGLASAGTQVTGNCNTIAYVQGIAASGNFARVGFSPTSNGNHVQVTFDCSGASPSVSTVSVFPYSSINFEPFASSDNLGVRHPGSIYGGSALYRAGQPGRLTDMQVMPGGFRLVPALNAGYTVGVVGAQANESWLVPVSNSSTSSYYINRVEAAA